MCVSLRGAVNELKVSRRSRVIFDAEAQIYSMTVSTVIILVLRVPRCACLATCDQIFVAGASLAADARSFPVIRICRVDFEKEQPGGCP